MKHPYTSSECESTNKTGVQTFILFAIFSSFQLSRFVFSVCVFCLSPGASSSLVSVSTREALESVLFRNMLVLTECERVANQACMQPRCCIHTYIHTFSNHFIKRKQINFHKFDVSSTSVDIIKKI